MEDELARNVLKLYLEHSLGLNDWLQFTTNLGKPPREMVETGISDRQEFCFPGELMEDCLFIGCGRGSACNFGPSEREREIGAVLAAQL